MSNTTVVNKGQMDKTMSFVYEIGLTKEQIKDMISF